MSTLSFDVKDSEAREQLNDLEDYVEHMRTFTRTVLYDSGSSSEYAPYQTDVDLADSLSNYDVVALVVGTPTDNQAKDGYIYLSGMFDVQMALTAKICYVQGYGTRFIGVKFTDTTFNVAERGSGSEAVGYTHQLYKIIGYKY